MKCNIWQIFMQESEFLKVTLLDTLENVEYLGTFIDLCYNFGESLRFTDKENLAYFRF